MAESTKVGNLASTVHILGLHENIFREIFGHLDIETVYFTLRHVCREIKNYVDEYVTLGGIFMLAANNRNHLVRETEILYVLRKSNMVTSISSKLIAPFPDHPFVKVSRLFGAIMNGRVVAIGNNFKNWERTIGHHGNFQNLYEYIPTQNKWTVVESRDAYTNQFRPDVQQWCPIGESKLLLLHSDVDRLQYSFTGFFMGSIQILGLNCVDPNNNDIYSTYSSKLIDLPPELKNLYCSTMTRVANDKIMLIGGKFEKENEIDEPNQYLWQGVMTNNETDVEWEKIEVDLTKVRELPICFKLQDNVYIAGGLDATDPGCRLVCCDRYNLKEGKYYETCHSLPQPNYYDDDIPHTAIDDEESFAIIGGRNGKGRILIFTENKGFEEVQNFSAIETNYNASRTLIRLK